MKWSEGLVHRAMRRALKSNGWTLIAGEYPGGSDHDLYPLNVVDPTFARDQSPDPRRHSQGELIPDLVAIHGRKLCVVEAKPAYSASDEIKLRHLLSTRSADFFNALDIFGKRYGFQEMFPLHTLKIYPTLAFPETARAPPPVNGMSYLLVKPCNSASFVGALGAADERP